jgi:hypothetical protein
MTDEWRWTQSVDRFGTVQLRLRPSHPQVEALAAKALRGDPDPALVRALAGLTREVGGRLGFRIDLRKRRVYTTAGRVSPDGWAHFVKFAERRGFLGKGVR